MVVIRDTKTFLPFPTLPMNLYVLILIPLFGGTETSTFSGLSGRGSPEYYASIRTDYKFRLVNMGDPGRALNGTEIYWPAYYKIDIRVDPCRDVALTGGRRDQCCSGTGGIDCQDHTDGIYAGNDLLVAYMQNARISTCDGTVFSDDLNCGTYLEIHRMGDDPTVLSDLKLFNAGGVYQTVHIPTTNLCTGEYEIWWVVRTRSGPYVQYKKLLNVLSPSCQPLA
jgi:hypothetical protein